MPGVQRLRLPPGLRLLFRGVRPTPDDSAPALNRRSADTDAGAAAGELRDRAQTSALGLSALAAVVAPAWSGFDLLLEPRVAASFVLVRFLCLVPMLAAVWLLWRRPVGRRHPELLGLFVLGIVQAEIAWMLPQVQNLEFYLLGFTLAIYTSGCLLVARPLWTGLLVLVSWSAVLVALLTSPTHMPVRDLLATGIYLASGSTLALIAHRQRYSLAMREFRSRVRLEREEDRTQELLRRLERQSQEDALTGLANRRRWDSELAAACASARETGTSVGVVLVDLDHFKQVNDSFGHAGGDEALRQVAGVLRNRVRAGDLVARLGGDELALLLPGVDLERARTVAEEVRLAATALEPEGFPGMRLTLSLGAAVATGQQLVPEWLTSDADEQLYMAKSSRNAVSAGGELSRAGRGGGAPTPD
jgi:diguanylate cyclase (GGDEF)-like protein